MIEEKLKDEEIYQVADDEKQQDWDRLEYQDIYKQAFIDGAKWARTKLLAIIQQEIADALEQAITDACKFSLDVYTGRVNGSDIHQKEDQYIKFNANKESIKYVIDLFCDEIRKTNNNGTHNEVIAEIIGQANRMFAPVPESLKEKL